MSETWPERLNRWLDEFGWSPAELVRKSGVNRDNVYKYVSGAVKNPRGEILERLASAFGRTEAELRYGIATEPVRKIPLLTMNEVGTLSPLGSVKEWGGKTVPAATDTGDGSFIVEVDDDGCAPVIGKGDQAICNPDAPPQPGRFVIARVEGLKVGILRKYRPLDALDSSKFQLVPVNQDFPVIEIGTGRSGEIIGLVVKVIKQV
jgi:SOS-response transcriptional repressor LexA